MAAGEPSASSSFVEIGADPILRGADWIVRASLVVHAGCVRVALVRAIGRTIAFDRAEVLIVIPPRNVCLICSHIIS